MDFKRKFSMSMYKNLSIKIGEMTFLKDFVNDKRGDLYPLAKKSDDCLESVENNEYILKKGFAERLICQFFPFATFELSFTDLDGEVGFSVKLPETEAYLMVNGKQFSYSCEDHKEVHALSERLSESSSLVVSCRPGAFDVYCRCNNKPEYVCTVYEEKFKESNQYEIFTNGYAFLRAMGSVTVKAVTAYIDNGVSMADIRPMKYEDGSVLMEGGKLYFTAPWDFDLSTGNDELVDNGDYKNIYVGKSGILGITYHEWYIKLYTCDWFLQLVKERWAEISDTLIIDLIKEVDEKSRILSTDLAINYSLWCSPPRKISREPVHVYTLNGSKAHTDFLISWLNNRKAWLDEYWKI